MTWANLARLMEATDGVVPTQQIRMISAGLESFNSTKSSRGMVLSIFELQSLKANQISTRKAIKWLASIFDVFDDEMESDLNLYNDLGEVVYQMNTGKETEKNYSLNHIQLLLELNCGKMKSNAFTLIREAMQDMSANERRWFIRYWLRTPRNGINRGTVAKIIARHYGKKQAEVKKHLNFNSVGVVSTFYEIGSEPPCNLSHGGFVMPMLAKEIPLNKWPSNRIVDYKYDGNRYQIHKDNSSVIIFNRKGKIVTHQFPEVVDTVREYEIDSAIFDGEIYPIKEDGTPDEHKKMGTRVHSKNVQEAMSRVPVKWVIFDCLKWGSRTIMDLPYNERLEQFRGNPDQAHRMPEGGDVLAFYNVAINDGFEGIIVKDASLPYEAGKRSKGWAKYKPPRIELDVVILSAEYGEGKRANVFGTFEVGVSSPSGFVGIGSVGTGFSDTDLVRLTGELRRNITDYKGKKYYFTPTVILEVRADLVTRDSKGNIGLRFPRCIRIRDDKFVSDINTLRDTEALE